MSKENKPFRPRLKGDPEKWNFIINKARELGLDDFISVLNGNKPLTDEEIIEENIKLSKSKQRYQDINRIERKSVRDRIRLMNVNEEYYLIFNKLLEKYSLNISTKKHDDLSSDCSLIIHISDTHANELINLVENKFDLNILSKRLKKLSIKAVEKCKKENIKNVLIAFTGDGNNSNRRDAEKMAMATGRCMASFIMVDLLQMFIREINEVANVSFAYVVGNESRIEIDNTWSLDSASDNHDFIIYQSIKRLFKNKSGIKFYDGEITESLVKFNNQNILLVHGHQLAKDKDRAVDILVSKYARKGIIVDFILSGHLHHSCFMDFIAQAGSMCGGNGYSSNSLLKYSKAMQAFHYIYDNGERESQTIDLQNVDGVKGYDISEVLEEFNAICLK